MERLAPFIRIVASAVVFSGVFLQGCCAASGLRLGLGILPVTTSKHSLYDDGMERNSRPLIGILSQPGDGDGKNIINQRFPNNPHDSNISYIAASYVKFVEAGGARAVPLVYNEPEDVLRKKFAAINGILFPGGDTSLQDGPFYRAGELLFNLAIEANDRGDYFPVYGVCLGFELLSIILSKNHEILERFSAEQTPGVLQFVSESAKQKSIFKRFATDLIDKIDNQELSMENHKKGLSPVTFEETRSLSDFFEVLTTTPDLNNKVYVSTVQGYKYPVTAVQWHPEKNAFEWGVKSIPHNFDAIRVTQSVANYVVSELRKSTHRPSSLQEEENFLMYNYGPVYSGKDGTDFFDQSYVFF